MKPGQRSLVPVLLIAFGAVLIIGSLVWFFVASGPLAQPTTASEVQDIPYPEIARIGIKDAKAAFELGNAVFIDTRGERLYAEGHIPGAIVFTGEEPLSSLDQIDRSAWIITYCTWPAEESSARVAQLLLENGFTKVTPILGGLEAWVQAGYPIEP